MSRSPEEVNKLTESIYKNVMEQFNPGLRNLVNLGKNYEKSVAAMTQAGKVYFDAVSKIGESTSSSLVSKELGIVLMELAEVHKTIHLELEEIFRKFHKEIIAELERKTEMDVKYMNATFKRYQSEHRMKQDSLERSQADLRKLRRKSQGKNASKYESKENECLETLTSRQMEMQKFVADGCREALLEEKRRFCFLVDKHCTFSYDIGALHHKADEMVAQKLQGWQEKCSDATSVPNSVLSMIEGLRTPVSLTPQQSPDLKHNKNGLDNMTPPPAPPLQAQPSPLPDMFTPDTSQTEPAVSLENSLSRTTLLTSRRPKVCTIFPHTAGNNNTLLSFQEGDIITLLIPDERDGWLYGELSGSRQRGWFPSSYCRPYTESEANRSDMQVHSRSAVSLNEEADGPVPSTDCSNTPNGSSSGIQANSFAERAVPQHNGVAKPTYLTGGNPFTAVKLRPTVTNDRSAPVV